MMSVAFFLILCILCWSSKAILHPSCTFCNLNETAKSPAQLVDSFLHNEGPFPVTDVFFVIVGLSNYDFVKNSEFWVAINVLRRYTNCSPRGHLLHCDTRIHIITDSYRVVKTIEGLGRPFYVYELDRYDEISLPFKTLYSRTHNTVNTLDYEFLCFNRWLLMNNITRSWNLMGNHLPMHHHIPMTRILSLDLDVLMTTNAAKFSDGLIQALALNSTAAEPDFDVIVVGLGAINLFSNHGLHRFSTFVFDWFNRSADVVKAANEHYWKYFSDMMIMKHYIEHAPDNNSRINSCFEYWKGDHYYEWRDISTNQCLLQKLGCVPMSSFNEMMNHNSLHFYQGSKKLGAASQVLRSNFSNANSDIKGSNASEATINVRGERESMPYCLIHFQSREAKIWLFYYGLLLEQLLHWSATTESNITVFNPPPLVVQLEGSKQMNLLVNYTQRVISTFNAFLDNKLNELPVLRFGTKEYMSLIPFGPDVV